MSCDQEYKFFYKISRKIRNEIPCGNKLRVVLKDDLDEHGMCEFDTKRPERGFMVTIHKSGSEEHDIHILLHEYAHVLSWFCDEEDHGVAWQSAYGRIYRWYEKIAE
jgi:Zn-dependent peptidase ImmA (M78 family)